MLRVALALVLSLTLGFSAHAQQAPDQSATGGAPTLQDIMARQNGASVDDTLRRANTGDPAHAVASSAHLGALGGQSDPELWRALRYGSADITASSGGKLAAVLVQGGGMEWLAWRAGPLRSIGGWGLVATLIALAAFYLLRGQIKIDSDKTGRTVTRFKAIERFGHWLLGGSFILLGLTGLATLFARVFFGPVFRVETISTLLNASKWIHNNVAWAFIIGLILIFVMWVVHNVPNRSDIVWLRQFGGIIGHAHPPAKKFNAGQKMIFWSVIVFGSLIAISGVSLLFPFELPMFAGTFSVLHDLGITSLPGLGPLPTELSPQEEMQFTHGWHAIMAFVLIAIVLAHIYIGSVGMEGAYDAMGSGEVDEAWAQQHHSIWLEEIKADKNNTPAQ